MNLAAYWRLLRDNRNFRLLWIAQVISELGDWFYALAIVSFVLELTGSAQMVALAFLMEVFPQVVVSPAAGVLVDRLSRRRIMLAADWARAAIVLAMLLVQSKEMLWLLLVLLAAETICWAHFEPASRAIIPNIATPEQVPLANSLAGAAWSMSFAVGAALGGGVQVLFGRGTVFVLDSLSFVASALLIQRMRFIEPHAENRPPLRLRDLFDFSPIAEGIRYVKKDAKLFTTMFVKAGAGLVGANWVILPIMGERLLPLRMSGISETDASTLGISVLFGARGAGSLVGTILSGSFAGSDHARLRRTILAAFVMGSLGYVGLGAAGSLGVAALTLVVAHCGFTSAWTSSTTLLQAMTEDAFRGRVFSAEFALSMLSLSASSFVAGQFVDAGADVRSIATWTGVIMLIPAVAWVAAGRLFR